MMRVTHHHVCVYCQFEKPGRFVRRRAGNSLFRFQMIWCCADCRRRLHVTDEDAPTRGESVHADKH